MEGHAQRVVRSMPEHKVLYRNSEGIRRWSVTDDDKPGKLGVYTEVDTDSILAEVREAREADAARSRPINRHLAVVPMTVYEQSIHENWDDAKWRRWLNDPDNASLRVWGGRV